MVRCVRGGILSLLTLPREQWEAIEADLFDRGWTIADLGVRVPWRALLYWLRRADRNTSWARETHPETAPWSLEVQLLAEAVDTLRIQTWMRSKAGKKNQNRPKPIPRPGQPGQHKYGHASMTIEETREFLAARRAAWTCMKGCHRPIHRDRLCREHFEEKRTA